MQALSHRSTLPAQGTVCLPVLTGDRLAQELMQFRHDIPIILCTGYSEHISEERAKAMGIREYILKPLGLKNLAATIRKVLPGA